jgi:CO/xanthine dehydrogenase Mo-binding subunit
MAADIGQGSDTVLAQCVAEAMGVSMKRCRVFAKDTDTAPLDLGSYSSRVTFMAGNAALEAGQNILKKLQAACARLTGLPASGFCRGPEETYLHKSDATVSVSFMDALTEALANNGALIAKGIYRAPKLGGAFKGSGAGLSPSYSYQAFVAQVSVDEETGHIRVKHVWAAHDCGMALNRTAVEGQIEGSVHMGLGQALTEQMLFTSGGQLKNPNLLDYKILSPLDTPHIEAIVVESCDPEGPMGAKECGEGALAPIIPAVANAVYDAVGIRLTEVPMTPERVLKALEKKKKLETRRANS